MFLLVLIFFDLGAFERHWSLCYHDGDWSDESVLARLVIQTFGSFFSRVSKNL